MKYSFAVLQQCPLFEGIERENMEGLLGCLGAKHKVFSKNEFVFHTGQPAHFVGVVLHGSVNVVKEDFWGKRAILTHAGEADLFAEAFSCVGEGNLLPVSVIAAQDSEILLLNYQKIITTCSSACVFHTRLIHNMVRVLAQKNIWLTQKMEHLTKPTTREKLLSYLSSQAIASGSNTFTIPFNRQELADFLSVERSAMSSELSKMQQAGLLSYKKNEFTLFEEREG